jgi:hypothetical protein
MRRLKYGLVPLFAIVLFCILSFAAFADSPHFLSESASGPDASGNLTVNFKLAGLGNNVSTTVTATANETAVYACQNGGGNFPSDPKKTTTTGVANATGNFISGKNGQIVGSLTLLPLAPNPTPQCGSGQNVVLVSVSYANVAVSAPQAGTEGIPGTFSQTFFDI